MPNLQTGLRACALAMWFAGGLAVAQPRVQVPPGCGSEEELRAELARLLGSEAGPEALPDRLRIERLADGQHALELELRGEFRSLRDSDCRALFKSAAVIAAAGVEPALRTARERSEPPAAPPPAAPPPDTGPPPPPPDLFLQLAIGVGATAGVVPEPAPQLELSAQLLRGPIGLAVAAHYQAAGERFEGAGANAPGVRVEGLGARLSAVYAPLAAVQLQGGVVLDRLSGEGLGRTVAEDRGSGFALALALEAGARPLRLGPFHLLLAFSGRYALVRPSFEIAGRGEVYRVPRFGGAGIARLGWTFR